MNRFGREGPVAKFERLEPRPSDRPVFDGREDDDEADESSRIPLLIVIALLVAALFAGVVWLAYNQGVERGRTDAPRTLPQEAATQPAQPLATAPPATAASAAPSEDQSAETDSVPPPPTPIAKTPAPPAAPTVATTTPNPPPPKPGGPAVQAVEPPPSPAMVVKKPPPAPPQIATHAPLPIGGMNSAETAPNGPAKIVPAPGSAQVDQAPPAAAPAKALSATKAISAGRYLLQIGAYKSEEEADDAWKAFQRAHPAAAGYVSSVNEADLGAKGTWYRLRIGGFADKDAANSFCDKLKGEGASCILAH